MDDTAVDWEKEKRIKKEREKAAKDLLEQEVKQIQALSDKPFSLVAFRLKKVK